MLSRAVFFICILWCSAVQSAELGLLTGEHGTFTRVVFKPSEGAYLGYSQTGDEIALRFAEGVEGLDTVSALSKLNGERVQAITLDADRTSVRLGLSCACGVKSFRHNGYVVLDISESYPVAAKPVALPPQIETVPHSTALARMMEQFFNAPRAAPPKGFECRGEAWCTNLSLSSDTDGADQSCAAWRDDLVRWRETLETPKSSLGKIKSMIGQGLLEEAHAILDEVDTLQDRRQISVVLSAALDAGSEFPEAWARCSTASAFWASLATHSDMDLPETDDFRREWKMLPRPLTEAIEASRTAVTCAPSLKDLSYLEQSQQMEFGCAAGHEDLLETFVSFEEQNSVIWELKAELLTGHDDDPETAESPPLQEQPVAPTQRPVPSAGWEEIAAFIAQSRQELEP